MKVLRLFVSLSFIFCERATYVLIYDFLITDLKVMSFS